MTAVYVPTPSETVARFERERRRALAPLTAMFRSREERQDIAEYLGLEPDEVAS